MVPMDHTSGKQKFLALLRGINVGGHHKVPMKDLQHAFQSLGFSGIKTLLNSGNVVFEGSPFNGEEMENKIESHLSTVFGFPIPVVVRKVDDIGKLIKAAPFKDIELHQDIRLYVTFLKKTPEKTMAIPWVSDDGSFQIRDITENMICSVLDVSQTKSTDAMKVLEKNFGKQITTRNWNTLVKIVTL
jgi:uncharacterized protein (DUF1697 family)